MNNFFILSPINETKKVYIKILFYLNENELIFV